jgi:hypothetical protein
VAPARYLASEANVTWLLAITLKIVRIPEICRGGGVSTAPSASFDDTPSRW